MTQTPHHRPGLGVHLRDVTIRVTTPSGPLTLLEDISLTVAPGEFVCILGSSGSGKSTLVKSLLGQLPVAVGSIRLDGCAPGEALDRRLIGYVPQQDLVHESLTVARALHYAARLRLPQDTTDAEIAASIREIEEALAITHRHDTVLSKLSGGEIKRVSLAAELLARPRLLVVDEATSSLDPATDARIMHLLLDYGRRHGTTILCVTHHLENAELADQIIILNRGRIVWQGKKDTALTHFGVTRLSEVFLLLEDTPVEDWVLRHKSRSTASEIPSASPASGREKPQGFWFQFRLLFCRHWEVLLSDRRTIAFLLGVPVIMILLTFASFDGQDFSTPYLVTRHLTTDERDLMAQVWGNVQLALGSLDFNTSDDALADNISIAAQLRVFLDAYPQIRDTLSQPGFQGMIQQSLAQKIPVLPLDVVPFVYPTFQLVYTTLFGVLLLGFLIGITEIAKERPIIQREIAAGIRPSAYVSSKFALAALVLLVQVLCGFIPLKEFFSNAAIWHLSTPVAAYQQSLTIQVLVFWLAGCACAGAALAVSAVARRREQALLALPLLILPQLLLGGIVIKLQGGPLTAVAQCFVPAYWGYRGAIVDNPNWPVDMVQFGSIDPSPWIPVVALLAQSLAMGLLTWLLLKRSLRLPR
jgi:ABC-type multidrug transport system ATPase subunit